MSPGESTLAEHREERGALLRPRSPLQRVLIVLAVVAFASAMFMVIQPHSRPVSRVFFVLPVIAAGLLFGWRGGLIAALSTAPLAIGLSAVLGENALKEITPSSLGGGLLGTVLVGTAVGAVTDLSRRLRDEIEQRQRAQRDLLEAQRRQWEATREAQFLRATRLASLGSLAAGVAHEINNPLGYLTSNLHSMRTALSGPHPPPPEELKDVQDAIDESIEGAERIDAIVKAIRVFSPRPSEELEQTLDVRAVLTSALEAAESRLRDRATTSIQVDGAPKVAGNQDRLSQVFLNLLVNAAEAIPAGKPREHRVTVTGRADHERVTVEISDTGPGIKPDVLPQIFEPFFSTKPPGAGTGLGLFVCKGIVTAMGGSLGVRTELGRGTTFSVELPAAPG